MENTNINTDFDLGSDPVNEDFDPFASDDEATETVEETEVSEETVTTEPTQEPKTEKKPEPKEPEGFSDKPPVFEYAGATENISDTSKTFDELRIEKSYDFPELEDGKRVTWTVEYGKITKTVPDPKDMSIGKMKSDIETSAEFETSLKKRGADKNPTCKIKPRVTAQSKGQAYKGVFANMDEADTSGKAISIVPGRDGNVYEIRNTRMGKFITPIADCEMLSEVRAGFIPALPRIPQYLMTQIVTLFRQFTSNGNEHEALVNVYYDTQDGVFITDVPEQIVTKGSVESVENPDFIGERYIHYMDIHSHNSMKAFFSGTDDNDEKATRLYSVIGRLDKYFPDIKTRISNGGKFWEIDPALVFEHISSPVPNAWKDKVFFRKPHGIMEGGHEVLNGKAS